MDKLFRKIMILCHIKRPLHTQNQSPSANVRDGSFEYPPDPVSYSTIVTGKTCTKQQEKIDQLRMCLYIWNPIDMSPFLSYPLKRLRWLLFAAGRDTYRTILYATSKDCGVPSRLGFQKIRLTSDERGRKHVAIKTGRGVKKEWKCPDLCVYTIKSAI